MNILDIYEDSPNGYDIITSAPRDRNVEKIIDYYLDCLDSYPSVKFPLEYAICHYGLAVTLFNDRNIKQDIAVNTNLERAKRIENALYYFNQCLEVFAPKDYPIMYSIVNIYMAKLFRERSLLTVNRSFLADRSSPEESIHYGIDHALEALDILSLSRPHQAELALCCLELGHIFLLQSELPERAADIVLKEQTLTYLERALGLSNQLSDSLTSIGARGQPRNWRPDTPSSFPSHIKDFLEGNPFNFLEGCAYYLLGRLEASWGMMELEADLSRVERSAQANPHHTLSFEHFCRCVRPKYLDKNNCLWSDAHHRVALLIIKHPTIVDSDFNAQDLSVTSDIYLDSAISHLQLALRCPNITKVNAMDIHFHLAQAYISKLQLIIDKVPYGESITKAVSSSEGLDLINSIDKHLNEALSRVTAANTQSVQDAYVYFFACLKLAEYRMLEAAATPNMSPVDRENHFRDAVEYIIDACLSRPLADNMDLHYIATCQLGQVMMAVKRQHAASKSYAKILFCLSSLLNRSIFNFAVIENKLRDDLYKHTTQAIAAAVKETKWIKLHLGPTLLHERVTPGYATWSFEDIPSARYSLKKTDSDQILEIQNNDQTARKDPSGGLDRAANPLVVLKATPPKGIPPLKLPIQNFKKVYLSGEEIEDHNIHKTSSSSVISATGVKTVDVVANEENKTDDKSLSSSVTALHFKPPIGPVPLSALGHSMPGEIFGDVEKMTAADKKKIEQEILEGKRPLISPYTERMRSKVPPIDEMIQIEKTNRVAYGLTKGKVVHLIPNKALRDQMKTSSSSSADSVLKDNRKLSKAVLPGNKDGKKQSKNGKKELKAIPEEVLNDVGDDVNGQQSLASTTNLEKKTGKRSSYDGESLVEESVASIEEEFSPTRPRSQKVKFSPPTLNNNEISSENPSVIEGTNKEKKQKSFLFWGKRKDENKPEQQKQTQKRAPKPWLSRLFTSKKIKPVPKMKIDTSKWREERFSDSVGLWASKQAYYVFMLATRQSRMELLIKCKSLRVIEGERVSNLLYHAKPSYRERFEQLRQSLIADCEKLIPSSPNSLKELSQLSVLDLQILFRSHNKMIRKLDEFEFFLTYKMTKTDYFLPMILAAPVFTRDIGSLDESLLDSQRLISNLAFEKSLAEKGSNDLTDPEKVLFGLTNSLSPAQDDDLQSVATRKSKSSNHTKVISIGDASLPSNIYNTDFKRSLTDEERKQQDEERAEVLAGKMTYSLSTLLDGCHYVKNGQQGAKEMLIKYLGLEECLMIWNLPVTPHQQVTVTLIWRENSASQHEFFSVSEAIDARRYDESLQKKNAYKQLKESKVRNKTREKNSNQRISGIVVEFAKSDIESSHLLQYIQRYIMAVHSEPLAKRLTLVADAVRSLSCALSITELLLMVPLHVTSLVICCPPVMRIIPWHLLLIETFQKTDSAPTLPSKQPSKVQQKNSAGADDEEDEDGEKEVREIHLLERYCVRLGPSLSLFELNCMAGSTLRQSVGHHRLCAIDGDDHEDLQSIPTSQALAAEGSVPESAKLSSSESVLTQSTMNNKTVVSGGGVKKHAKHNHAAGIRGADLEVASVAHTWSADPEDYHILNNHAASYAGLETGVAPHENYALYTKFKDQLAQSFQPPLEEDNDGDSADENDTNTVALDVRASKILKQMRKKQKKNYLFKKKNTEETGEEDEEEEEDLNEEEEIKEQRKIHQNHIRALTMCRVLHICSSKTLLSDEELKQRSHPVASIILPKADPFNFQTSKRRTFTSLDVIKKLFLRNCGLVILSKYGILDDIVDVKSQVIDLNWEFLEAFHLAGASTTMFPLWEGSGQGIGTLAHILFLLRFYSILPSKSRHRLSIAETCRKAQLWLRDVSANDAIAFVHKAPIPAKARQLIIEEFESYVNSTVATIEKKTNKKKDIITSATTPVPSASRNNDSEEGNRVGGSHRFFTHILLWGSFVVSGYGGNIHHPDLSPNDSNDEHAALFGTHITNDPTHTTDNISSDWNDKELNNIEFEASILRMEGKIAEAVELEKRIRELKIKRWKERMKKVKETGWKAGRGILDTLDYFDKLLLEQDDEAVSVSSEESESEVDGEVKKNVKLSAKEEQESEEKDRNVSDFESSRLQFNNNNSILPSTVLPASSKSQAVLPNQTESMKSGGGKPQFRPLDLDTKNRKAIYDEWKTKVGDLNMEVKQPVLPPDHFHKKNKKVKKSIKPHIKKKDNFDFAMMKSMKAKTERDDEEDDEEDLDDYDEEVEKGDSKDKDKDSNDFEEESDDSDSQDRQRDKKNKTPGWRSIFGQVRSYAEIAQMLSEQYPIKVLDERVQALEQQKEQCAIS